ncbi:hypothetical protein M0813_12071 [Anaeramoeba flamelloides]|uniref:DUF4476 domain-containing protein n=1 Tax=Anaeramoeba flamelloides TaxID=1746091 RepID=A0ABQ8ZD23_9EUKA|nr:hypothetical protein M0813_12071 [Anaeramoeba flamelloides]
MLICKNNYKKKQKEKKLKIEEKLLDRYLKKLQLLTKKEQKYLLLEQIAGKYYFTMEQFIKVCRMFLFENQTIKVAEIFRNKILDKKNEKILYESFIKKQAIKIIDVLSSGLDVALFGDGFEEVEDVDEIESDYVDESDDESNETNGSGDFVNDDDSDDDDESGGEGEDQENENEVEKIYSGSSSQQDSDSD